MRIFRFLIPALALLALSVAAQATAAAIHTVPGIGRATSGSAATGGSGGTGGLVGTSGPGATDTGGAGLGAPAIPASTPAHPIVAGIKAQIIHGVAYAPAYAPIQVQRAIWAGNQIRHKPYIYGGGHGVWNDAGYDCSGSVSYVLHAAGLLMTSMDSSGFESWGLGGRGQWITVYTNPGHAFVQIAGIRFDTSAEGDPNPAAGSGPRWRPVMNGTPGFAARHPSSL